MTEERTFDQQEQASNVVIIALSALIGFVFFGQFSPMLGLSGACAGIAVSVYLLYE